MRTEATSDNGYHPSCYQKQRGRQSGMLADSHVRPPSCHSNLASGGVYLDLSSSGFFKSFSMITGPTLSPQHLLCSLCAPSHNGNLLDFQQRHRAILSRSSIWKKQKPQKAAAIPFNCRHSPCNRFQLAREEEQHLERAALQLAKQQTSDSLRKSTTFSLSSPIFVLMRVGLDRLCWKMIARRTTMTVHRATAAQRHSEQQGGHA